MLDPNKNQQRNEDDVGIRLMEIILMLLCDQTGEKYELIETQEETA